MVIEVVRKVKLRCRWICFEKVVANTLHIYQAMLEERPSIV